MQVLRSTILNYDKKLTSFAQLEKHRGKAQTKKT